MHLKLLDSAWSQMETSEPWVISLPLWSLDKPTPLTPQSGLSVTNPRTPQLNLNIKLSAVDSMRLQMGHASLYYTLTLSGRTQPDASLSLKPSKRIHQLLFSLSLVWPSCWLDHEGEEHSPLPVADLCVMWLQRGGSCFSLVSPS